MTVIIFCSLVKYCFKQIIGLVKTEVTAVLTVTQLCLYYQDTKHYYIDKVLAVQNLISFGHKTNSSENSRLILNFGQEAVFLIQSFRFCIFMT